jgi:hypothetical protein
MCGLTVLLYLGAYLYCLCKDPDALRSEKYLITKLAIKKGYGDSFTGLLEGDRGRSVVEPGAPQDKKQ